MTDGPHSALIADLYHYTMAAALRREGRAGLPGGRGQGEELSPLDERPEQRRVVDVELGDRALVRG